VSFGSIIKAAILPLLGRNEIFESPDFPVTGKIGEPGVKTIIPAQDPGIFSLRTGGNLCSLRRYHDEHAHNVRVYSALFFVCPTYQGGGSLQEAR
jgi:hypothetical protein